METQALRYAVFAAETRILTFAAGPNYASPRGKSRSPKAFASTLLYASKSNWIERKFLKSLPTGSLHDHRGHPNQTISLYQLVSYGIFAHSAATGFRQFLQGSANFANYLYYQTAICSGLSDGLRWTVGCNLVDLPGNWEDTRICPIVRSYSRILRCQFVLVTPG